MDAVKKFYNDYDESSRLTTDNARRLEFITTTHVLDKYITNDDAILDLGAGAGIYSFHYADKGHSVISTDYTPKHVELIQNKIECHGYDSMTAEIVDATDLSRYISKSFDVVLCLGPMYHLTDQSAQMKCIEESLRVLKPDGILAISYINRHFMFPYLAKGSSQFLSQHWMTKIIEEGRISSNDNDCFWTDAYFHTPSEIEGLFLKHSVTKLGNVATDGIGIFMKEQINQLTEDDFNTWIQYHLKTCNEPSILGMSNHGMYVCRKNQV